MLPLLLAFHWWCRQQVLQRVRPELVGVPPSLAMVHWHLAAERIPPWAEAPVQPPERLLVRVPVLMPWGWGLKQRKRMLHSHLRGLGREVHDLQHPERPRVHRQLPRVHHGLFLAG